MVFSSETAAWAVNRLLLLQRERVSKQNSKKKEQSLIGFLVVIFLPPGFMKIVYKIDTILTSDETYHIILDTDARESVLLSKSYCLLA